MLEAFTFSALLFIVYFFALMAFAYVKRASLNITRILFTNLTILYFLIVFTLSLFPIALPQEKGINLIPFYHLIIRNSNGWGLNLLTIILNFLLYIPMGFISHMQSTLKGEPAGIKTLLLLLLVSITLEFIQLILPFNRVCNIDQVIFDLLGGLLGFVCFSLLYPRPFMTRILKNILYQ